ncbi:ABC transporter substrate-binding protein [Dethiosulfatarculus sandiegensis]|uniref:ABC transporter substrate-binding protein n=1 Tax=Dethiosulfatarculus sandiegensis TaxID=1429043 RepID=A0A0D2J764_9BACT|nr:ABC transporter substrate binding protein [Dethiosulfatarculus sandiegensis]KIX14014.1 hypothetical protein X474_13180 [Dethiosulfatarculus sandiegensis]
MKRILFQFCFICLLFLLPASNLTAHAKPVLPMRVFILHSYDKGHICGSPQHLGILEALKKAGWESPANLALETYYMETKRANRTPAQMAGQAKIARKKIKDFKPDLLITIDDNAFSLVGLGLSAEGLPVVFSGMNQQPEYYNRFQQYLDSRAHPGHNVTGVYEKLHIKESLKVLNRIIKLDTILIITDSTPTGAAVAKQIKSELFHGFFDSDKMIGRQGDAKPGTVKSLKESSGSSEEKGDYRILMKTVYSWEEYTQEIKNAAQDPEISACYLAALGLNNQKGEVFSATEIIEWTTGHMKKPATGPNYEFIRLGLFGGASVDFQAMGRQAGHLAARILEGEPPAGLSIMEADRVALVFNLKRAEELKIKIPRDILLATDEIYPLKSKVNH